MTLELGTAGEGKEMCGEEELAATRGPKRGAVNEPRSGYGASSRDVGTACEMSSGRGGGTNATDTDCVYRCWEPTCKGLGTGGEGRCEAIPRMGCRQLFTGDCCWWALGRTS